VETFLFEIKRASGGGMKDLPLRVVDTCIISATSSDRVGSVSGIATAVVWRSSDRR